MAKKHPQMMNDVWELFELSDVDKSLLGEPVRWSNRRMNEYKTCRVVAGGVCRNLCGIIADQHKMAAASGLM